jgi:hypothetical protein
VFHAAGSTRADYPPKNAGSHVCVSLCGCPCRFGLLGAPTASRTTMQGRRLVSIRVSRPDTGCRLTPENGR